jgi:hypothetical protein
MMKKMNNHFMSKLLGISLLSVEEQEQIKKQIETEIK